MLEFKYSELNTLLPTFPGVVDGGNNIVESTAPTLVPLLPDISSYTPEQFLYWKFDFLNPGEGTSEWQARDYDYGMKMEKRIGIGSFYFYPNTYPPDNGFYRLATPWRITELENSIECKGKIKFWSWLSTFFNLLIPDHRKMIEWIWSAMQDVGCEYSKKARRFIQSMNPEESLINPTEDFYDIKIGVLDAYPIYLDPEYQNYQITALKSLWYPNQIFSDLFVTEEVYKVLRDVCIDGYAVIPSDNPEKEDRFFKVIGRKSTIESNGNPASFTIKGDYFLSPNSVLQFIADDSGEDISTYKIGFFWAEGTNETYDIEWLDGTDKILKVICYAVVPNGTSIFVNIDTLVAAINTPHVNKWCTAKNVSNPLVESPPIWNEFINWDNQSRKTSNISYENIINFTPNEEDSGDWIPPEGKKWIWYEGYSQGDDKIDGTTGFYTDDKNKYRHLIRVIGDLSYLKNNLNPKFYITTGKKFKIDNYVIDLPILTPHITKDVPFYTKDIEYTFYNNFIEFHNNPRLITTNVDILYSPKVDVIEYFLYELYGKLCSLDWELYNYSNVTGKEAIRTIMQTLQNLSTTYDFDRSSNVYGGLPVSPYNGRVLGLYESYDYEIIEVDSINDAIKLKIPENERLHFFFINGAAILINDKFEALIDNVNHVLATMEVENIDRFKIGDIVNIKLPTNFKVKVMHDDNTEHEVPCIHTYCPFDFAGLLKTYSDIYEKITNERPEVLVWNQKNINGIYHVMDAYIFTGGIPESSDVLIEYYSALGEDISSSALNGYAARYNDKWRHGEGEMAQVHFHWATHKFLLIHDPESEQVYRAYIDSPMDTIFNPDDVVQKGDVICRNINIFDENDFSNFTEFNKFIPTNSVNNHNKMLMVSGMPVKYGFHFPGKELES